ncbi:hypothetical protein [Citrobacter sp. Cpo150]|uniref:hypothetical protein n=1 Tax=Citrobacter sp. Cpo150 TaxID=2985154 RepID=UPI002578F146|nr:hypothetical protein [Citrobacter sp. Cpo150]MDM2765727.1 hypothetical protein [Citrobacter sp. Cpo150]
MKKLLLLVCLALSGCAGTDASHATEIKDVECLAKLKLETFGGPKFNLVSITGQRYDRFGKEWVRVQNKPGYARFYGFWKPADMFYDYSCKS